MRWWPQRLGARIAVALLLAAVTVFALDQAVARWDRKPAPARRAASAMPPGAGDAVDLWPASAPAPTVGFHLQPVGGSVALARRLASLQPDIAPVVEILADGSLVLRRPQPLATAPVAVKAVSRDGFGAGIVLPADQLAELSPTARAALLGLLQQWFGERPVSIERLRTVDLVLPEAALRRLLSWVP